MHETPISNYPRPALKTLTYSLTHLTVAIAAAFALTRSWQAAITIGLIEPLVQTMGYTLHVGAWSRTGQWRAPLAADQQILSSAA